jgi:hypothetical protein
MMRALKIISISLVLLALAGVGVYYYMQNKELNKSYESATQQVTQLQAKLDAVGTFVDVFTVKAAVRMGQEIKDEDLVLQTIPTSSVPGNVISNKNAIIGKYWRIGFEPGITLTSDLINIEKYIGSVYDRDVFLDSLPVGTQVGDYLDVRIVLPGGEEFVVFPHKRVNARFDNAIKLRFDESDLWIYTSMNRDKALYKAAGLQLYATKYTDPGSHDKTVAYYPVRKEVLDIMNISGNLTDEQKSRMWNESLRASIDAKLKFYSDPLNSDASKIAGGVSAEDSRYNAAESYYKGMLNGTNTGANTNPGLVDPNATPTGTTDLGNLGTPPISDEAVKQSQEYLDSLGSSLNGGTPSGTPAGTTPSGSGNLFDEESPIE